MSNQSYIYDTTQALIPHTFTRTGYSFLYWNTQANGSGTTYTDGQIVTNLATTSGAIITLYAIWPDIQAPVVTLS